MKTLHLRIPSHAALEAELSAPPFALWEVADQPLLYHWLDFAVDGRFEAVCLHGPARHRSAIEDAIAGATLWPIQQSFEVSEGHENGPADFTVDHLPGSEPAPGNLASEIDWLSWHASLTRRRLNHLWDILVPQYPYLIRGHRTTVHPSAALEAPYWIGEGVRIEAGVRIGPGACVGNRARIGAGGSVVNSQIASGVEVLSATHFENHTVTSELIFNHQQQILHRQAVVPDFLKPAMAA